ncbi:MAG TPA: hypothetical protein VGH87_20505 [Polyangiaceae bacterium]
MNLENMLMSLFAVASAALVVTTLGVASARQAARRNVRRDVAQGPYRTTVLARIIRAKRPGERLVAAGGALLACAAGPALIVALLTLKWEGIGVTLMPALLVVAARLYASLVTFRGSSRGQSIARVIAHASLLLDVPLLVFSIVHVRVTEDGHESLSLAVVAGTFALADGLQALLVLTMPSSRVSGPIRE